MTSQEIRQAVETYISRHGSQIDPIFQALIEQEIEDEVLARHIPTAEADELFALVA